MKLLLLLFSLLFVSCGQTQPPVCSNCCDIRKHVVDSLKDIYEDLQKSEAEFYLNDEHNTTIVTPVSDTRPIHYDTDQSDTKQLVVDGRQVFYPASDQDYPVFCGKKNTNCNISGSLYILRISKNTGEEYKSYLTDKMRTKIFYQ